MSNKRVTEEEFLHAIHLSESSENFTSEQPVYKGSCHCKFLSYTVRLDLSTPHPLSNAVITRCNCSICVKYGLVSAAPAPASSFTLTSPPGGRTDLKDYRTSQQAHRWLCPTCGVQVFQEGTYDFQGMEVSYLRVNAATLDGRVDGEEMVELKDVKVKYYGGRDPTCIAQGTKDEPWSRGLR